MVDVNKGIINSGSIGGDARVSSVVHHTGDNIKIRASGSAVNVKSRLDRVTQSESPGGADEERQREKLNELLQQLQSALSTLPGSHRDNGEAVAIQAKVLADAAGEKTPNKTFIAVSAEALKAAAKFVAEVAPPVATIVSSIVSVVGAIAGI